MPEKATPMNLYKKIVVSFIGLTVILVIIVLYLSFAEARINITPVKEAISSNVFIDIAENSDSPDILNGKILETEVEGNKVFKSSSSKSASAKAGGKVIIYNHYNKNQPLVATTRLLSPEGLLFRLKKYVLVPAGGQVEAEVYADKEGSEYEIGPAKFIIPGLWRGLQDKIYAESKMAMRGGNKEIKVVTNADIKKAKDDLAKNLFNKGKEELQNQLGNGKKLLPEVTFKEILESTVDAVPGEEMEEFTVNMKLKVITLEVSKEKLLALAETKLRTSLSRGKKLVNINKDSLLYTLENYDSKAKTANLKVYIEGFSALQNTSLILNKDRLVGLSEDEVKAYLTSFDAIKEASIRFTPFWIKKVPSLKDHIKINIKY